MPPSPAPTLAAVFRILASIALLWIPVLTLHLTPALFAVLITYGAIYALAARLRTLQPKTRHPEGPALLCLLILLGALIAALLDYAVDARETLPALLQQTAAILDQLHNGLPPSVASRLPTTIDAVHEAAAGWLRSHAEQVQVWGRHTLRGFGYVIAGIVIGALAVMQQKGKNSNESQSTPLSAALRRHFDDLVASFNNVVLAQLSIAAINTVLTALFLLAVMPLAGRPLPMAGTLVALTFLAGLLPVVGNLFSNTVIVIFALSSSVVDAALALAWLVAIHKLEYFLNAHIIGTRIRAHAWELLSAMLLMEALFGLAGLVSAPIVYSQVKQALHRRGWID